MPIANRRNIVLGDVFWNKLMKMKAEESRSISELIREALIDLFEKRRRQSLKHYDPVSDTFTKNNNAS